MAALTTFWLLMSSVLTVLLTLCVVVYASALSARGDA